MGDKGIKKIGIIGCGVVAEQYINGLGLFSNILEIVACADLDNSKANKFADKYGLTALKVEELLEVKEISIVLNLTVPKAHFTVSLSILNSGKHVYSEKPLALNYADGEKIIKLAEKQNLKVGCAPDTFLGFSTKKIKNILDSGTIGEVIGGTASFVSHGHESWHPNAGFYYQKGAGPLFDMGPYYITSLVYLLGPVEEVFAVSSRAFAERKNLNSSSEKKNIKVEVDTHYLVFLKFKNKNTINMTMSFDVWKPYKPILELYGTKSSIKLPDPNNFEGSISLFNTLNSKWEKIEVVKEMELGRGIGLADMVESMSENFIHKANGYLALHVLNVMESIQLSANKNKPVSIKSKELGIKY